MKKYLFMAILACLTILSGCKKSEDKGTETPRVLNEIYDGMLQMVGAKYSGIRTALLADGWNYLGEEKGEDIYSKIEGDRIRQFYIYNSYDNTDTVVINVSCYIAFKGVGDDCMTADDMKALVQHIGQNPTVNNEQIGFELLTYGKEQDLDHEETDYQKAIGLITEACNYEVVECYWEGEINSVQVGRGTDYGHRIMIINVGDLRGPE